MPLQYLYDLELIRIMDQQYRKGLWWYLSHCGKVQVGRQNCQRKAMAAFKKLLHAELCKVTVPEKLEFKLP